MSKRWLVVLLSLPLALFMPAAQARPEVCPSVYPQPCTYVPTEEGAFSTSGDWEVVIVEGNEVTRLTGSTALGEIQSHGGLPVADLITVRALSPGSWIIAGSTDCSECGS